MFDQAMRGFNVHRCQDDNNPAHQGDHTLQALRTDGQCVYPDGGFIGLTDAELNGDGGYAADGVASPRLNKLCR